MVPARMTGPEKAAALRDRKSSGSAIAALTAYDYASARLLDEAGVDLLLVGDSLGMVVLGYPDTTHVTMEHMLHHTAAAARGATRALVVADLPINSYGTPAEALTNARALVAAGAEAVKLEGGLRQAEKVRGIVEDGIPVLGHLGMLPQRVREEGGYKIKGRSGPEAEALHEGTAALQEAGCFAIVLESVIAKVSTQLTAGLDIPTIGIGCGDHTCNGEIAVLTDVVGSYPWFVPPFATRRADLAGETSRAVGEYISACRGAARD
jgi:3-methyl-2-oxobutanoate hydroxymethyltransferase